MTTTRPRAYRDPDRFNRHVLGRDRPDGIGNRGYTSRQREIARSVVENQSTLVPTGHGVGKSHLMAGILLWHLYTNPNSLCVATAPSSISLNEILIKEVEAAYHGAKVPLGGRLLHNPFKIVLSPGWNCLAFSTANRQERFSGHHNKDLMFLCDEASGVEEFVYEAAAGLNASRELLLGNPLRPSGTFYERCRDATNGTNPSAKVITVSSLESPHAALTRSPWGMADATFIQRAARDYGINSLYWQTHVLGQFPSESFDAVIPRAWLDAAASAPYVPGGARHTAIDLGLGSGLGDKTVVLTRDSNSVLAIDAANTWSLERAAEIAAEHVRKFRVEHHRCSFDKEGIGADFAARLRSVGIHGAREYRGGAKGNASFYNLRTCGAWMLRQRMDPARTVRNTAGAEVPQVPFSIRRDFLPPLRAELQELRYEITTGGVTKLELAELFEKRLKHSPDYASTLIQSFAFDIPEPPREPMPLDAAVTAVTGVGWPFG